MDEISINEEGFATTAMQIVSPNFDSRPSAPSSESDLESDCKKNHVEISMIVIHNISLPPNQYGGNGIIELFTNKLDPDEHTYYAQIHTSRVSSHFLIRRDGELVQFVSCLQRAWHAGASHWQGRERCNDFSVGIELEGSDFEVFEHRQYVQLNLLVNALKDTYPITSIVGHSNIASGRKTDPGPYFDWNALNDLHEVNKQ